MAADGVWNKKYNIIRKQVTLKSSIFLVIFFIFLFSLPSNSVVYSFRYIFVAQGQVGKMTFEQTKKKCRGVATEKGRNNIPRNQQRASSSYALLPVLLTNVACWDLHHYPTPLPHRWQFVLIQFVFFFLLLSSYHPKRTISSVCREK